MLLNLKQIAEFDRLNQKSEYWFGYNHFYYFKKLVFNFLHMIIQIYQDKKHYIFIKK